MADKKRPRRRRATAKPKQPHLRKARWRCLECGHRGWYAVENGGCPLCPACLLWDRRQVRLTRGSRGK